jgi:hypothetical protein
MVPDTSSNRSLNGQNRIVLLSKDTFPVIRDIKPGLVARALSEEGSFYLDVISQIESTVLAHEYTFVDDEFFKDWTHSDTFNVARFNQILSLELIDKAHLAAVSALIRTKRWAEAICLMYEAKNFLGWASAARGLLESSGDIVDGLLNISFALAQHHKAISVGLSGKASQTAYSFMELEQALDHYVFAKWMRVPRGQINVLQAKENAAYVANIERLMPDALHYYRRLCGITHPSSASIEYLYEDRVRGRGAFKLTASNDAAAIDGISEEFPKGLQTSMMMSCNPPLLILRVLHKFKVHPKLLPLKQVEWTAIKGWQDIERSLGS